MKTIRSFPEAEIEFDHALSASPDPLAFRRDVDLALDGICRGVITHRNIGRSRLRECVLARLPYLIVYLDEDNEIVVVAFAHKKRRRGYWKSRLKPS